MQRYERIEGTAAKFWEAGVEGRVLTVRFGRIGAAGQGRDKSFADERTARRAFDRLVREKAGKGYRAVGGEADTAPEPTAQGADDASGKVDEAPAAPAQVEKEPAKRPDAGRTGRRAARAIFTGTPLPSRSRPGPTLDGPADWAAFAGSLPALLAEATERAVEQASRDRTDPWRQERAEAARAHEAAFAKRLEREPPPPDAEAACAWFAELCAACPAMEQRGWYAAEDRRDAAALACLTHFARWLAARSGPLVLAASAEALSPRVIDRHGERPPSLWHVPAASALRAALSALPEAAYETILAEWLRRREARPDPSLRAFLGYALADDRPGADHALTATAVLPEYGGSPSSVHFLKTLPLLVDLPPSQGAPWRARAEGKPGLKGSDVGAVEVAATVLAVARAAGESPAEPLLWLLEGGSVGDRGVFAAALIEARVEARADAGFDAFVPVMASKGVRDALDRAEAAFPDWTLRGYLAAMSGRGEAAYGPRAAALVAAHGIETARAWVREGRETAGRAALSGRLERLVAAGTVTMARREAWPAVLREPPWRGKLKPRPRIALRLEPIETPFTHTIDLKAADADRARRSEWGVRDLGALVAAIEEADEQARAFDRETPFPEPHPAPEAGEAALLGWLSRRLAVAQHAWLAGYEEIFREVGWHFDALALLVWQHVPRLGAYAVDWPDAAYAMVARFGVRTVPELAALAARDPGRFLPWLRPIGAAEIAPAAAHALLKLKPARADAMAWLRAHPVTAAMRLLPNALADGPERAAADAALRFLAQEPEGRAALDAAIAAYRTIDPRVPEAAASGVDADPLEQVPARPPKLPPWVVPASLSRPRLPDGAALPDEAVQALVEMLTFTSAIAPYAGIEQVRAACEPDSLDAFAVDLFRACVAAGANTATAWTMHALGLLGGDGAARELTRQIRVWGQAGNKPRGKDGIAVLGRIGTDVALMNLSALAEKNPVLQLRAAARAAVAAVAHERGLSEVALADRLAPDLGLDERGGLDLDFGPRAFRVGFDETLKPWVRDAQGKRLPSLPRAARTDEAEKAKAAARLWAGLKKDAEAEAKLQITRLETMLATGRRVAPGVFWPCFASHRLLRHLAGRLVWGLYDDDRPTAPPRLVFRLAEDLSPTDAADAPLAVTVAEAPGVVGLVHPLHLDRAALAAWSGLFGDYEIAQPFPQLGRETYAFTPQEAASASIARFSGARVAGGRLRGVRTRGWTAEGGGEMIHAVERRVAMPDGGTCLAVLRFSDGLWMSPGREGDAVQTLGELILSEAGWHVSTARRFGDLDAITASELLRVPSLLAATGGV